MSDRIVCPTCGKQFRANPEAVGKRVRCPGCREPFIAELEQSYDLAPSTELVSQPPSSHEHPFIPNVKSVKRLPYGTPEQRDLARSQTLYVGRHLTINGTIGAAIVWFGLQRYETYRGFGLAGCLVCVGLGITMLSLASCEPGISLLTRIANYGAKVIKVLAVLFLLFLVLLIGGLYLLVHYSEAHSHALVNGPPARLARRGSFGSGGMPFNPASRERQQSQGMLADMKNQFGPERIVHVQLAASNQKALEETGAVRTAMQSLRRLGCSFTFSNGGNGQTDVYGAPLEDINKAVDALANIPGNSTVDRKARMITIDTGQ